jgi:aerobic carbon-monoxide dehydrogenase small subunit
MSQTVAIAFVLNGRKTEMTVASNAVAADVLREECGLTSVRVSCDQSVCGVCTVLADGAPIASCTTLAFEMDGKAITTLDGIGEGGGVLHPIQEAFRERAAFQCGFCTPGMILSTKALLEAKPAPTRDEIREWLSANVCRCTGYSMIVEAVQLASAKLAAQKGG